MARAGLMERHEMRSGGHDHSLGDRHEFSASPTSTPLSDEVTRVESGGRIRVVGAADYVLILAKTVDGSLTVPAIRVYGDMVRLGERGAEAAEHLREVVLGI